MQKWLYRHYFSCYFFVVKIEGYLTTSEVAERLNVSVSRVKNLVTLDRLHPIKLGKVNLFKLDEVENFTRRQVGRPPKVKDKKI